MCNVQQSLPSTTGLRNVVTTGHSDKLVLIYTVMPWHCMIMGKQSQEQSKGTQKDDLKRLEKRVKSDLIIFGQELKHIMRERHS